MVRVRVSKGVRQYWEEKVEYITEVKLKERLTQIVVVFLLSLLGQRTGFCIFAITKSD